MKTKKLLVYALLLALVATAFTTAVLAQPGQIGIEVPAGKQMDEECRRLAAGYPNLAEFFRFWPEEYCPRIKELTACKWFSYLSMSHQSSYINTRADAAEHLQFNCSEVGRRVNFTRDKIISLGVSEKYFDEHFKLKEIEDNPSLYLINHEVTIGEYAFDFPTYYKLQVYYQFEPYKYPTTAIRDNFSSGKLICPKGTNVLAPDYKNLPKLWLPFEINSTDGGVISEKITIWAMAYALNTTYEGMLENISNISSRGSKTDSRITVSLKSGEEYEFSYTFLLCSFSVSKLPERKVIPNSKEIVEEAETRGNFSLHEIKSVIPREKMEALLIEKLGPGRTEADIGLAGNGDLLASAYESPITDEDLYKKKMTINLESGKYQIENVYVGESDWNYSIKSLFDLKTVAIFAAAILLLFLLYNKVKNDVFER